MLVRSYKSWSMSIENADWLNSRTVSKTTMLWITIFRSSPSFTRPMAWRISLIHLNLKWCSSSLLVSMTQHLSAVGILSSRKAIVQDCFYQAATCTSKTIMSGQPSASAKSLSPKMPLCTMKLASILGPVFLSRGNSRWPSDNSVSYSMNRGLRQSRTRLPRRTTHSMKASRPTGDLSAEIVVCISTRHSVSYKWVSLNNPSWHVNNICSRSKKLLRNFNSSKNLQSGSCSSKKAVLLVPLAISSLPF